MSETSERSGGPIADDPQMDLAFLRAVALHRPVGHHKHFNVIPILSAVYASLVRQRDREQRDDDDEDDENGGVVDREMLAAALETSPALTRAQWTEAEKVLDRQVVWERCSELYDMDALDELEETAEVSEAEGSAASTVESLVSVSSTGIPLEPPPPKVLERRDFSLQPWSDFEELVAPRRIADDDDAMDTDEEKTQGKADVHDDTDEELSEEEEDDDDREDDQDEEDEQEPETISSSRGRRGSKATTAQSTPKAKAPRNKAAATRSAARKTRSSRR